MRAAHILLCVALFTSAGLAQTAVPPPPKPADSGPSLEVTMKFIQDKLNDVGKVNYAAYYHDNANGREWTNQFANEASNVVADTANCRISFHWKATRDGAAQQDVDAGFNLREVQNIVVKTQAQNQKDVDTDGAHPTWDARIDPPIFALVVRRPGNRRNTFNFRDEEMANRVAKALMHAVELCGGGQTEPF